MNIVKMNLRRTPHSTTIVSLISLFLSLDSLMALTHTHSALEMQEDRQQPLEERPGVIGLVSIPGMSKQVNIPFTPKELAWKTFEVLFMMNLLFWLLVTFMFSLDLMGTAFKVLGGCTAGEMFSGINNPIAGLMVGMLCTVLIQSSSTTTSIVVSLVGAGSMSVRTAVPVIMGANIGTSVTNTIVSFGHAHDPDEFQRAFAGATVHDAFNFLAVLVLLPIEIITHMLEELTSSMVDDETASDGEKWEGPVKEHIGPWVAELIASDKSKIKSVAKGTGTCDPAEENLPEVEYVGSLIKGGVFYNDGNNSRGEDESAGVVCLVISLIMIITTLVLLVKLLKYLLMGTAEEYIKRGLDMNGYLAMVVGAGVTLLVQSSSLTTSVLTPLVGLNVITLEKMFPLTLGANIGTTGTALMASLVSDKPEAVQIAFCHLFFNIFGILIWYPVPYMRKIPMRLAVWNGKTTNKYRWFPAAYLFGVFFLAPLILLGVSSLFSSDSEAVTALGSILVVFLASALCYAGYWWKFQDGRRKFLDFLDAREERKARYEALPKLVENLSRRLEALENGGVSVTPCKDEKSQSSFVDDDGNRSSCTDVQVVLEELEAGGIL